MDPDEYQTRTLVGGPHDGRTLTWEVGCGLATTSSCPVRDDHRSLVSYDEDGVFVDQECRECWRDAGNCAWCGATTCTGDPACCRDCKHVPAGVK